MPPRRRVGRDIASARQIGQRLLSKAVIGSRLTALQAARVEQTQITAEQTIADIRLLADIALGRVAYPKTIVVDGEPTVSMVRNVSFAGAARALELLGLHQSIFNDKLNVNHTSLKDFLESIADVAESTPAGRIKAKIKDEPTKH